MEELKLLVEMVADLPQMALWVLAGFWAYKVIVIGSIYGLIRFIVEKAHSWLTSPKDKNVRLMLDGECISGSASDLVTQLHRIKRATGVYIHGSDVRWLADAITDKLEKEKK